MHAYARTLLLLAAAAAAHAKTLTVAKSGTAYSSVQAGLNAASAGDTVLVEAGVYGEAVTFGKSGSAAGGFITLRGRTGAILDGTGLKADALVSVSNRSFVRVEGFEVRNLKGSGTPIGISQVFPGDVMRLEFDVIGTMTTKVAGVV